MINERLSLGTAKTDNSEGDEMGELRKYIEERTAKYNLRAEYLDDHTVRVKNSAGTNMVFAHAEGISLAEYDAFIQAMQNVKDLPHKMPVWTLMYQDPNSELVGKKLEGKKFIASGGNTNKDLGLNVEETAQKHNISTEECYAFILFA